MSLIKFKRGLKANLPTLNVGEPGFTTDTKEFYIGATGGNIQLGDMLKNVYDVNNDGLIDDSDKLDGNEGTYYLDRANHTGTILSTVVSDFTEAAQDAVAGMLTDSGTIDFTYDDDGATVSAVVKSGSIDTTQLADGAVTFDKIDSAYVETDLSASASPVKLATAQSIKIYTDSIAAGLDVHAAVMHATTEPLPTVVPAGSGTGKTLTASANGVLSIDGFEPAQYSRILVKDQADPVDNGIYTLTTVGDAGTKFVLTRASDFDGAPSNEVSGGDFVLCVSGTVNATAAFAVVANGDVVVDTGAINFTKIKSADYITAGVALDRAGNVFNVLHDDVTIGVDVNNELYIKSGAISTAILSDDSVTKDKINADVAGNGLGQNLDGSLEVKVDGSTIEITTDTLNVKAGGITVTQLGDDAVTKAKIHSDVAGNGLGQNVDGSLEVKVDDTTIEITADTLNVKNAGIGSAKIAPDAVTAEKINADVAGSGLGQDVDGSLMVNVDNSTIEIGTDAINVKAGGITVTQLGDDAVTKAKIHSDVAGNGLGQNVDGSLEVKVDDSTLEITTDVLNVKAGGITVTQLGDDSVTKAKVNADVAGDGIIQDTDGSLKVNTDNTTIEITADALNVKALGIGTSQLAAGAVTYAKIASSAIDTDLTDGAAPNTVPTSAAVVAVTNALSDRLDAIEGGTLNTEAVQDIVGAMVTNTTTINMAYDDDAGTINAVVNADSIDKTMINADVAGSGLGQDVDGSLMVNVDNSTIEITTDTLNVKALGIGTSQLAATAVTEAKIATGAVTETKIGTGAVTVTKLGDDSVTKAKVNADVAGNGLGQNVDGSLEVNVDDSTIEITTDVLNVKAGGITVTQLADDSVTKAKVNADVAGDGIVQDLDGSLKVNTDNTTIEITSDALNVKALGIGTAQLAATAVTEAKIATGAVTETKIGTGAVTVNKLGDDSVTKAKINADVAGTGLAQDTDGSLKVSGLDSTFISDFTTAAQGSISVDNTGKTVSLAYTSGVLSADANYDNSTIKKNGSNQLYVDTVDGGSF